MSSMRLYKPLMTLSAVCFLLLLSSHALIGAGNLTQNSSRECAICHFRWIDQFVAGHGTELSPLETEDVAGEEMMCFSCHDGSTDDSRIKIWLRDRHQTGMVPSDKVTIPKIFPLSRKGEMVCATCHSAHSVPTDTSIERTIFLRISSHDSQMCEMCHTDQASKELSNHPVHKGKDVLPPEIFAAGGVPSDVDEKHLICESCHTAHGGLEHKNLLFPARNSILCSVCHADKVDDTAQQSLQQKNHPLSVTIKLEGGKLAEVYTGLENSLQCLSCHVVHTHEPPEQSIVGEGGANREVNTMLRHSASDSSLCLVCHPDKNYEKRSLTAQHNHPLYTEFKSNRISNDEILFAGAGDTLQCLSCHKIHQHSPGSRALVAARGRICTLCHVQKQSIAGTDHDLAVTAPDIQNRLQQKVDQSGVCGPCHIPHNAEGKYLWAKEISTANNSPSTYCLNCHEPNGPAGRKSVGVHSHPVNIAVEGVLALPLFSTPDGKDVMECGTCHEPHQWSFKDKREGDHTNKEGNAENSFLRKPSGKDSALCASCHSEKFRVEGTDHDLSITAPLAKNIADVTAIQAGVCSSCHVPHNAAGEKLWARPDVKDVSALSGLCFSCHMTGEIAAEKTVGDFSHPVNVQWQGHVDLPLAENTEGKKILGCHTCHDPHQWNSLLVGKGNGRNEEGNAESSFLRKANLKDPLLCRECHKVQALVSGSDHDMRVTAGTSLNLKKHLPKDGSVCSSCHAIHNAGIKRILWNAPLADSGRDFMENACYGCHQANQAGKNKIVTSGSHPTQPYFGYRKSYTSIMDSIGIGESEIPLYDPDGEKTDRGEISCPTCHDPHVWFSKEKRAGTGQNREGTIVDSFLREGARSELCYACHGMTTLLLYRFYHDAEAKKDIHGKTRPRKQ
ncbi:cytochrome c3 family protein [Desulfosediminicola flagellatus]|uniref:cytochrome c3 family protein n=1 Tax=Desulfosediminicola flagellatus TaxID=2569541 RepID=UPI0010AB894D|nr:cytochrome c3 family protein [Desulfosediminicola flagellatus]